ncbi:B-cell receptor CD22 isoform X2 [Anarrhichthys ocellatus]|uniref:B-cell receptor CD22 isoform X2 n=1 Tax=Anarrhichthys ocellatus TaxID=433405 RepID=UPI0012ED52F2|nr:B-cell receptor CD22-like isoform X2 [Anarrhichthys ocellatus]
MNAQTVGWLVFLAVIKNFTCDQQVLFKLEATHLTAKEGSCIEIKCRVNCRVDAVGAYLFWIKDGQWDATVLTGTVIYSTNITERPVSTDFADRVKYIGSLSSSWNSYLETLQKCSISICDLKKTDNGDYAFRFVGKLKWITKPVRLEVKENPCLITFEKPPVVNESDTINLTCSTLSSCPSSPKIGGLTQLSPTPLPAPQQINGKQNCATVSFTVNWQDDGKEFSCQTDATDKNLIRYISLTVEYAPKDTSAKISPENVVEGRTVALTCSAKGRPEPNFTWFKNKKDVIGTEAVLEITSITESQNGEYHCEAKNKWGTIQSKPVNINVKYVPEVELKSPSIFRQGDIMTLTCNVKRSNPQPHTYDWLKDGKAVAQKQTHESYVVEGIEPEDRGSYTCTATNTVGNGTSVPLEIEVKYGPRQTTISTSKNDKSVGVGKSLTLYCNTEANPAPFRYSWYRHNNNNKQIDSSQWKSKTTTKKELRLDTVKRTDDACYRCNATNSINTGDDSELVCINVLYPPTKLTLSMDTEVREGQLITIRCTVESFPLSMLIFKRTSESNPQSSQFHVTHPYADGSPNTLQHAFNVTSTHTGFYTCDATNGEGSKTSERKKLVVNYCPKDVTVKAQPALVVDENKSLTLDCSARSYPPVTSVTWMKVTDGKSKILQRTQTFTLNSVSPSDSGLYSCEASNDIGTGNSKQTEVKVKYAPKHTKITTVAEHQNPDGTRSVTLSCSSQSYPQVAQYSWHKMKTEERDEKVSDQQNYIVYSDQPGVYYCITKNEMGQRSSDPVRLFDRNVRKTLLIILFVIILLIFSIVIVYRHKKKRLEQQGTTNTLPCFGFLGWWNGAGRRNRMSNPGMVEPFRSRDDLLPDQTHRPNAQRCQPRPDSTPASNINSVYSTVNLPSGQQGRPAQKIIRQQGGHTQDDSLNYASLHFGNKQKNKVLLPANVEDVYAKVSKKKPPTKNEDRPDYENASAARAPNPIDYDTDTSEDEVQVNYSQVSFKVKPGHQRVVRDSSSSDEDETQYSEVKI